VTAREIAESAKSLGIEVVDDPQLDGHEYHRSQQYRAIWEAVRLLAHLPSGRAVSIPKDPKFRNVVAKKSHVYARRWGLDIVTRDAGDVIVVARKVVKSNQTKGDPTHPCGESSVNNQRGAALQPSVASGSRAVRV
jgi:hypothetical protein